VLISFKLNLPYNHQKKKKRR